MVGGREVVVIIQARMGSSRLPGKVLKPLADRPVLAHILERVQAMKGVDQVVVATGEGPSDDKLAAFVEEQRGVGLVRGDEEDVLGRYYQGLMEVAPRAEVVVRITGDSPMVCIPWVERGIELLVHGGVDGVDLSTEATGLTRGFGAGVYRRQALIDAHLLANDRREREHVTLFIKRRRAAFEVMVPRVEQGLQSEHRLTLDFAEDYAVLQRLYEALYRPGEPIDCRRALRWLEAHEEVAALNASRRQTPVGRGDHPKSRPPPFWSARW